MTPVLWATMNDFVGASGKIIDDKGFNGLKNNEMYKWRVEILGVSAKLQSTRLLVDK